MNTDELQHALNSLANQASQLLRESLSICTPLYKDQSGVPDLIQFVVSNLFTACFSTSESALLLISKYRLWDAHILYRTVLEGTIKLMFVAQGNEHEILEKCNEFWNVIPEMKLISRHKKAEDLLSVKNADSNMDAFRPMRDITLPDNELSELESKYPKKTRKQLEQKWSFSEIVRSLSSSGEPAYDTLVSTYHDYGIGSHLVHMDGDAIGIIWDRNRREHERRISLEIAHGARMISALLTYAAIRADVYYKIYRLDEATIHNLKRKTYVYTQEIEQHYSQWINIEYKKET
ncbi:DUF5677 domain-containing protein [Paenibacillus sp. 32352]|uniref:DUF5677 domain-containing protein n=1 Tax=Paenibacillus sp. 32352 TaxID=1969111 RepID=UPI0009AE625D|nr:DUF5677 domain-containing protein [Paenibacillus sp. 32352]